jgi:hypothetical protein
LGYEEEKEMIKRRSFLKGLVAAFTGTAASESVLETLSANPKSVEISDHAEEKIFELTHGLLNETYIALFNNGKELIKDARGYARVKVNGDDWSILDGKAHNNKIIEFPKARWSWGDITSFAAFDAKEGGNMLFSGRFFNPRFVGIDDTPGIMVGDISLELL